jgi:high-affinity K+ transport system ATPase subunit B
MNKRMPVSAKLDPRLMIKSSVRFVVEVVAALTTVILLPIARFADRRSEPCLHLPDHPVAVVHGAVTNFAGPNPARTE